jgi:hypothetical protein
MEPIFNGFISYENLTNLYERRRRKQTSHPSIQMFDIFIQSIMKQQRDD